MEEEIIGGRVKPTRKNLSKPVIHYKIMAAGWNKPTNIQWIEKFMNSTNVKEI